MQGQKDSAPTWRLVLTMQPRATVKPMAETNCIVPKSEGKKKMTVANENPNNIIDIPTKGINIILLTIYIIYSLTKSDFNSGDQIRSAYKCFSLKFPTSIVLALIQLNFSEPLRKQITHVLSDNFK